MYCTVITVGVSHGQRQHAVTQETLSTNDWMCFSEIRTDRYTDMMTAMAYTPTGGKVISSIQLHLLLMMEIMCFGRRQERKVISTVRDSRGDECQDKEEQRRGKVRAHKQRSEHRWQHVTEDMLHRMSIDGRHTNRRRPLMMHLVNATIQIWIVKQPGNKHHSTIIPRLKIFKSGF